MCVDDSHVTSESNASGRADDRWGSMRRTMQSAKECLLIGEDG